MEEPISKLSETWIAKTRKQFRQFLDETDFPDPIRLGERGPALVYPEWLIMFIAVLSVQCNRTSYLAIHRMVMAHWSVIAGDLNLKPISERQLRDRLKKIRHIPGRPAAFVSGVLPFLEPPERGKRR